MQHEKLLDGNGNKIQQEYPPVIGFVNDININLIAGFFKKILSAIHIGNRCESNIKI